MNKKNNKKILFISSTGGHLSEMLRLSPMFKKYDYHIITEKTKSNMHLLEKHPNKVNFLVYGTKSNILVYPFKLLYNCFKSLFLYFKIKPKVIITTGAHTAGPMCCIGKIFGSKIIYIETLANSKTKTVTGRLIYHFADLFIVQWEEMLKLYPKAKYGGWIY
ncbi:MAG: polysaccharide biosynthesis protein [Bacilli bacterium]|nr:polysaccharide biosynthesis protein [Bacilli bacterium]